MSGGRPLASWVLLATLLLSSSAALAGAADQHDDHGIGTNAAAGPATRAVAGNQHKENTVTPPGRRHLTNSGDTSPRDKRNQMEQEYRRQQARRNNGESSDESNDKDAYGHYKEAEDGSIYSSADKSLCIAPNDNDDIVVRPCTNYDRREWTAVIVEGTKSDRRTYKFVTWQNNDDKCITVRDDVKEGARLKMGQCRDKEDYLWKLDDGGKWRPRADLGLCVDLGNAQQGTKPALRDCDDTKFQKWNVGNGDKDSSSSNSDSDKSDDKTKSSDDSDGSDDEDDNVKNRSISPRLDDDLCVSVENEDSIALEECNGKEIQSWSLRAMDTDDLAHHEQDGRYYMIQSGEDSDKCIGVSDAQEDRRLRLIDCDSKDRHQFWDLDSKGRLHPLDDDDLCSEISNVRDGANLRLVQCGSRDRQRWELSGSGRKAGDSNDSDDDNKKKKKSKAGNVTPLLDEDLCAATDGDEISLEKCRGDRKDQGWYIVTVETSNGDYYDYPMVVSEANGNMCLDVTDAKEGRKIILSKCDEDDKHQRWDIEDGRRWRPMDDRSLCADIQLVREGTAIRLMDCSGTDRQRWNYSGGDGKDTKESDSSDKSDDDKKKKSSESGDDKKKGSDDSDEECSDDESEEESSSGDDEQHVTMVFYGKGKTAKSTKSSKSAKGSKGGYYPSNPPPRPTYHVKPHPSPSKPSCKPKPSPSSDDYWDHVKESSKGSIYSVADRSLCVAFNGDNDIVMRGCTNSNDRQWSLMAIAGDSDDDMTYKFITWKKDRDKCITVRGHVKEGSELRMAKCDNDKDFLWKFNEGNKWRPKADLGLCVDLDKVREGTRPTLEDCRDTSRQRWDVGKGDGSRPSSPSRPGSPSSPSASRPGSRPTPRPTQDPATCSADRTCGRPRRPI